MEDLFSGLLEGLAELASEVVGEVLGEMFGGVGERVPEGWSRPDEGGPVERYKFLPEDSDG